MRTVMMFDNPFYGFGIYPEFSLYEPFYCYHPVKESFSRLPGGYNIELKLPDLKRRNLKIKVDNGQLVIEGHRKKSGFNLFSKGKNRFEEFSFYKSVPLTDDMDVDNIKARLKRGVLKIEIPKKKEFINYREIPVIGNSDMNGEEAERRNNRSAFENVFEKIRSVFRSAA